jgi:cell division protein FtsL
MVIGMIVFIMSVIFCIVWEAAVARSLELQKQSLQTTIRELDEQKRDLRATIAREQMPEEVVRLAMQDDVRFVAIDPKQAIRVGGVD